LTRRAPGALARERTVAFAVLSRELRLGLPGSYGEAHGRGGHGRHEDRGERCGTQGGCPCHSQKGRLRVGFGDTVTRGLRTVRMRLDAVALMRKGEFPKRELTQLG
jgi:hypothetical protein